MHREIWLRPTISKRSFFCAFLMARAKLRFIENWSNLNCEVLGMNTSSFMCTPVRKFSSLTTEKSCFVTRWVLMHNFKCLRFLRSILEVLNFRQNFWGVKPGISRELTNQVGFCIAVKDLIVNVRNCASWHLQLNLSKTLFEYL